MAQSRLRITTRSASADDLAAITAIYNQGIEDRVATLETQAKSRADVAAWLFPDAGTRYPVIVAHEGERVVGWAALRPYSHRCAYAGVADLSIYVERGARGTGVGTLLLSALEESGQKLGFHKIVLFALTHNQAGRALYDKRGFREVGVFKEHGTLDGKFADVVVMEKILAS